jgi:hypothetical protein
MSALDARFISPSRANGVPDLERGPRRAKLCCGAIPFPPGLHGIPRPIRSRMRRVSAHAQGQPREVETRASLRRYIGMEHACCRLAGVLRRRPGCRHRRFDDSAPRAPPHLASARAFCPEERLRRSAASRRESSRWKSLRTHCSRAAPALRGSSLDRVLPSTEEHCEPHDDRIDAGIEVGAGSVR